MKVRNYERQELIIFILLVLIIIEVISFTLLFRYKVYEYKKLTGIITNENIITLIVDKKEKEILNKNKNIYLNNKKLKYKIIEDKGVIIKKNNKKYYELLIRVKTPKNNKSSDYVELSIKNKKINILKLLKKIGEGD